MNKLLTLVSSVLLSASAIDAQTSILRAEVSDLPGPPRRFVVEGAPSLLLISNTVDVAALYDTGHYSMTVQEVASTVPGTRTLEVLAATPTAESFAIDSELLRGTQASFVVRGRAGSFAVAYLATTDRVGFLPLGDAGSWVLPPVSRLVGAGTISGPDVEFFVAVPDDPSLVGLEISAQAAIVDSGQLILSNPDSEIIR